MKKRCTRCKQPRERGLFNASIRHRDGLRSWCKPCEREAAKEYYQRDPTPYKRRASVQRNKMRKHLLVVLDEIRRRRGCAVCGTTDVVVLDFHHYVSGVPLTRMISKSYAAFNREIRKCIVLCANDHRRAHAGTIKLRAAMCCTEQVARPSD
jgi:hypothetical protein